MDNRITKISSILSERALWQEKEIDESTGIYEINDGLYVSIPDKNIIVDCNTGKVYDKEFLQECDDISEKYFKENHKPKYIYVKLYNILNKY